MCIADEMVGKANIEHMGDSANSDAEKVQKVYSRRNVEQNNKGQASANHAEVCSMGLNRLDSKLPHAITARRKAIFAQYVRPVCHKCSLKNMKW